MLFELYVLFHLEMTFRFESTSMVGQRCLLNYQLPWLENIELVNTSTPHTPESDLETASSDLFENGKILKSLNLEGDGWGSVEGSQMVLNNLFYITAKVYSLFFILRPVAIVKMLIL